MSDAYVFIVFVNDRVEHTFSRRSTADKYASLLREHLKNLKSPFGIPEVTVGKYSLTEGTEETAQMVMDDLYGESEPDDLSDIIVVDEYHVIQHNPEAVKALLNRSRSTQFPVTEPLSRDRMRVLTQSVRDVKNYPQEGTQE